jgi:hypothetical protein
MGALTSLNMSANGLKGAEAGKALGDAIAASVLKELDISGGEYGSQKCDVEFVQTFSVGLRDNRALTKIGISNNDIRAEGGKALAEALRGNQVITELNIASNNLGSNANWQVEVSGIANLADVIPGMGAISVVNILANNIPKEQAEELMKIMKSKESLKSLCGIKPDQQEADFSGQKLNGVDAMLIANDISDNGAISQFTFSGDRRGRVDSEPVTMETSMVEADFSFSRLGVSGAIMVGAFLPKCT